MSLCTGIYIQSFSCVYAHAYAYAYASLVSFKLKVTQPPVKPSEHMGSNLDALTDETLLQLKVDQRLQELSDLAKTGTSSKFKSERGGSLEVLIKNRVKWPHEYVLSGLNKERVTYDQLNVTVGGWVWSNYMG